MSGRRRFFQKHPGAELASGTELRLGLFCFLRFVSYRLAKRYIAVLRYVHEMFPWILLIALVFQDISGKHSLILRRSLLKKCDNFKATNNFAEIRENCNKKVRKTMEL